MQTITFNDKIGNRGLKHLNLLLGSYKEQDVLVEFQGKNIEGVCHIINEDFTKSGKWSHSTWEVAVPDDVRAFEMHQDWEMGKYFTHKTWEGVKDKFVESMIKCQLPYQEIDMDCVKRFVTMKFPTTAQECNTTEQILNGLNSNFGELYEAQQELMAAQAEFNSAKTAVQDLITAEETRKQAESLRTKTREVRAAMAKGMSLADLQALFNQ